MSEPIRRDTFVDAFAHAHPHGLLATAEIDEETRTLLAEAGVSQTDLYEIAGDDGVIRGEAELRRLFAALDEHDHDGSTRTLRDGTVRAAALALLHDGRAAERIEARRTACAAAPAQAPRQPSAWADAHYREVMTELGRRAHGLGEAAIEEAAGAGLRATSLVAEAAELTEGAGIGLEAGSIGGTALFAGAGPILALATTLYELGEANEAAGRANRRRVLVRSYAAGLAAGLDATGGAPAPTDPRQRAYFFRGRDLVSQMSPAERENLEDVLVLARRHATGAHDGYAARTYREAVMDVYEGTWKP